jgi:hypothetical protein
MTKRNKMLLLLAGVPGIIVLFCIFLYFSAPRFINSEIIKKKSNDYFMQKTGGNISFQTSDLYLFPIPHIVFRQVNFSVPDKAAGTVQSLDIYPDVRSLIKGEVVFLKLNVESPSFTIALSEEKEKKTLEEIEEKIRSVVNGLISVGPDLSMSIQKGRLDLTKSNHVAFSFDKIQAGLITSGKSLNLSLVSTSNLWREISFNISLKAENLESNGIIKVTEFHPHNLLNQLAPEIGKYAGDSDADFSVQFQTIGLKQVQAEADASINDLVLVREKTQVKIEDLNMQGTIEIEPQRVSVILNDFSSNHPELKISGKYSLDRASGNMELDLEGRSIDVQSTRRIALALGGDVPVIRNIFDIVQGGRIPSLHFSASGKSPDDLGRLHNMKISGRTLNGDIYIKAKDLSFHKVSGDVNISQGILEGKNIEATLEGQTGRKGQVKIGLKGKDAPFSLDIMVKADAGMLPLLLRQKQLIKSEAVLREMNRLSDTRGTVEGRLILGNRLDAIHAIIDVSHMDFVTRYEPLPFPLVINGGQVFFDEKSISTSNVNGTLGNSSFSNLTARLGLDEKADLEISNARMTISADELYPWVTSFEKIKPVLRDVPSMKGKVAVSSMNLKGPLYQTKDWKYLVNGTVNKFSLDSTFFPGKAEETSGMFRITNDELSLKDVRTRMIDSSFTVSGTVREFPAGIRKLDLSLKGEIGPKVTEWICALIQLPPDLSIRAPLSIPASTLAWEKDKKTTFDGRLVFGTGTQVALNLTKTPDEISVHEISFKDWESDATASILLNKKTADIIFKGILTSGTFTTILTQNKFAGSSLEGDFRTHIILNDPKQSVANGILSGKNIPVPWGNDIPLVIQNINLEAGEKHMRIDSAQLLIGDEQFSGKGNIDTSQAWVSVDMDISSKGFDFENIEKFFSVSKKKEESTKTGFPENFPLKGTLRIQSDFFKYRQFTWEPLHADVSFDSETIHIRSKKAALCGISTTGNVDITPQGAEIDIALAAKNLELQPTILCISDKQADITGTFEMKADIKAKGKLDTIAKSLNGSFSISAKEGKIYKSQSLDKTLDLVNKTENVKGKLPDLDKTIINYSNFTASGTIKEYIVEVEKSVLDASIFSILAQGEIDLNSETLDLNALVAPVNIGQRIVGKIPIVGHILGGNLVSIPVRISGNLSDPQVTFLSPSAVGSAFIGIMERTIKLPITIIEPVLPGKKAE